MAKVALLIGVSEYEPGLSPLPSTIKDIEAMRRVLEDPEIGDFEVKSLLNPNTVEMQTAIEELFLGRQRDDIVLLYFSGHGIKYDSGKLYFATKITRRNEKGELFKASTVSADFVHDIINDSRSRSRRQVIILDCCFSGAFANETKSKDDVSLDFQKIQLGGEGRAVLTSSTSSQYSFESIYTQYLVQGMETGEADENNDGFISVDELHQYVQRKVQENNHEMKPQIQAVIKEGYNIVLTKAPIHNRESIYLGIVKSWVHNGQISDIGRLALNELQNRLEIEPSQATAIEEEGLKPYKEYQRKLQQYKEAFHQAIQRENPIIEQTRQELIRLQRLSRLRDEDIALIEATLIAEQSLIVPPVVVNPSPPENSNFLNYVITCIIGVIGVVIGGSVVYVFRPTPPIAENFCADKKPYSLDDRISSGEEILLKKDTNLDKEAGVKAFFNGDCKTAIDKLNSSRQVNSTDPETLIYLNNAKARQQTEHIKIAVSVPIGTNPNVAKEILRGVAQAQDEVNSSTGINGKALEVAIANDDNDPSEAVQLATRFGKDASILAVVGHNSSNASLSAASVYQKDELVMMSPTSFAQNLTSVGNYIFRTAPSVKSIADSVSNYAIKIAGKSNFLICVDYQGIDNLSFNNEFVKAIKAAGGQINSTECDISARDFNPSAVISQAVRSGANALVLGLYIDKIKQGLAVAQSNQGQLTVFGSPTLLTDETLKQGRGINGLIISVPWYPAAFPNNIFPQKAQKLWGATVNWRTATAYDATLAIITGLEQTNRRDELQKVLHSSSFLVNGATGKIQFSPSGDRKDNSIFLEKVQQIPGTDKYEFKPIQP
ncbi:MAG: ABC transporter substrate-binding protein [Nostoc sp.]|uniref:caspase, EACC1-associated type n=1 Tax=Nostoc sp. TaxID=1180 RepID=UPI002FFC5E0A